jgi:hypothetical protein
MTKMNARNAMYVSKAYSCMRTAHSPQLATSLHWRGGTLRFFGRANPYEPRLWQWPRLTVMLREVAWVQVLPTAPLLSTHHRTHTRRIRATALRTTQQRQQQHQQRESAAVRQAGRCPPPSPPPSPI